MATVLTTLGPTVDLIRSKATAMNKEVQIERALVEGAFQILMSGDRERHDSMVAEAAQKLSGKVDLIVLAQASMTRLVPSLGQKTGLRILSSPRLAIEYTAKVMNSLPKK